MRRWICFWVTVLSVFMIMGYVLQDGKTLEMRKGAYVVFTHRIHTDSTLDTLGWIDSTGIHMRGGWFDSLFAPLAGIADTAYYSWFVNPDSILDSVTFTTDTIRFWRSGSQIGKLELRKVDSSGYSCYSDSANYSDSCFYADTAGSAKYADSALFSYSSEYSDSAAYSDSSLYADSAAWAGLLDGYNEDYFRDTNDVWRDSVHAYQEATDSLATPKVKADFYMSDDSGNIIMGLGDSPNTGLVYLFKGDSIGNSNNGHRLRIYRDAPEKTCQVDMYFDQYNMFQFYADPRATFKSSERLAFVSVGEYITFQCDGDDYITFEGDTKDILKLTASSHSLTHTDVSGDTVMQGDTLQYLFNVPPILPSCYHLGADSIVLPSGAIIASPSTGMMIIDTSGGDTMKCFLNSAWEVK